jgi:hypothetical protein
MASIAKHPPVDQAGALSSLDVVRDTVDVPGMMADRVGELYAAEERADRVERTERLIREAEGLAQAPA